MPFYVQRQVAAELRRRVASNEPLNDTLTWLGGTGAPVGDAVEMLVEAGLSREYAEHALTAHEDWGKLIRLIGGLADEGQPL
jgi:hypothetical protein